MKIINKLVIISDLKVKINIINFNYTYLKRLVLIKQT